jgi:hypothetical protein
MQHGDPSIADQGHVDAADRRRLLRHPEVEAEKAQVAALVLDVWIEPSLLLTLCMNTSPLRFATSWMGRRFESAGSSSLRGANQRARGNNRSSG